MKKMVAQSAVKGLTAGELQLAITETRDGEWCYGLWGSDEEVNAEQRLPFYRARGTPEGVQCKVIDSETTVRKGGSVAEKEEPTSKQTRRG